MDGDWADGLTFWIWHHLKTFASETWRNSQPLPSDEECEKWLQLLLNEQSVRLPAEAFRFYAAELKNMVGARSYTTQPHVSANPPLISISPLPSLNGSRK